jgi:VCBS repeat-containing protein
MTSPVLHLDVTQRVSTLVWNYNRHDVYHFGATGGFGLIDCKVIRPNLPGFSQPHSSSYSASIAMLGENMDTTPNELDWVIERINCEVKKAFAVLHEAVREDVENYKSQAGHFASLVFFVSDGGWAFRVGKQASVQKIVTFESFKDHIAITSDATGTEQKLKVIPVLTQGGHRKFRIDGEEGEPLFGWQLRRRVLETALFDKELI